MTGRHRKPVGRVWPMWFMPVGAALAAFWQAPADPSPAPVVPAKTAALQPLPPSPKPVVRPVAQAVKTVPLYGAQGLTPRARQLAQYIQTTYPAVAEIGGWRHDPLPDHPSGHAIDIMVYRNTALGDAIRADLQRQREWFGIRYTLWQVPKHFDHVHVTVW